MKILPSALIVLVEMARAASAATVQNCEQVSKGQSVLACRLGTKELFSTETVHTFCSNAIAEPIEVKIGIEEVMSQLQPSVPAPSFLR